MHQLSNGNAIGLGIFILLIMALYLISAGVRLKHRTNERKAILDKFSSAQDFASFMQTPAGTRFFSELSHSGDPGQMYLASVQRGIILLTVGGGVAWTSAHFSFPTEIIAIGAFLMFGGLGVLLSAVYLAVAATSHESSGNRRRD